MKNYFYLGLLALLTVNFLSAKDLVVGTTSGYAPYVSLDEEGNYVGFDIDFAQELAKKLDRKLVIKDLGCMPSLFLGLKQGKIDAILWAISITQERQNQMEMIYYQGETVDSLPLLFWKEIPPGVTKIEQLGQRPISVEVGSFQDSFLQSVPGLNLKPIDKVLDGILEMKYGKSVAMMIDPSLLSTFKAQFPEIQVLDIPLPPAKQSLGNGICINKSNPALIEEIRQAVKELKDAGITQALEKKWQLGSE